MLRYLAVAHFGRGRGDWVGWRSPPDIGPLAVAEALQQEAATLQALWRGRSHRQPEAEDIDPDGSEAASNQAQSGKGTAASPAADAEVKSMAKALQAPIARSLQLSFASLYPDSDNQRK